MNSMKPTTISYQAMIKSQTLEKYMKKEEEEAYACEICKQTINQKNKSKHTDKICKDCKGE